MVVGVEARKRSALGEGAVMSGCLLSGVAVIYNCPTWYIAFGPLAHPSFAVHSLL